MQKEEGRGYNKRRGPLPCITLVRRLSSPLNTNRASYTISYLHVHTPYDTCTISCLLVYTP